MSLTTDDEGAEAARLAEEEHDRVFRQRLAAASEAQRLARQAEIERVRSAMSTLETANPADVFNVRCQQAVAGTRLADQRVAAPSWGGQTEANNARVAREIASAEQAQKNELASRARWLEDQADVVEKLCAGQEPSQQAAIRAAFRAQAQKG